MTLEEWQEKVRAKCKEWKIKVTSQRIQLGLLPHVRGCMCGLSDDEMTRFTSERCSSLWARLKTAGLHPPQRFDEAKA